jgi:hypothetical protein
MLQVESDELLVPSEVIVVSSDPSVKFSIVTSPSLPLNTFEVKYQGPLEKILTYSRDQHVFRTLYLWVVLGVEVSRARRCGRKSLSYLYRNIVDQPLRSE